MSPSVVLADANVLIPRTLRDYTVYLGKAGAFDLHWSQPILDEVSRHLVADFGFAPDDAAELELRLTEYLPRALVEASRADLYDGRSFVYSLTREITPADLARVPMLADARNRLSQEGFLG